MSNVAENLRQITAQLPAGVQLVAVSKFHPMEALMEAYNAGQRLFGENRAQELAAKAPQMPDDVQWHFIGHLQTNKVRLAVQHATMIQSVDSARLLTLISKEAVKFGRTIDVLLQLHVAQEEAKTGFSVEELMAALTVNELQGLPNVRVRGLMAMASLTDDQQQIAREFALVKSTFDLVREAFFADEPTFDTLSMGMSDDWPIAVKYGATPSSAPGNTKKYQPNNKTAGPPAAPLRGKTGGPAVDCYRKSSVTRRGCRYSRSCSQRQHSRTSRPSQSGARCS